MVDAPLQKTGVVAFLAHLDDIRSLLNAGHKKKHVYDLYAQRLAVSYPQFTRYIAKHISERTANGHQKERQDQKPAPAAATNVSGAVSASRGASNGTVITGAGSVARRPPVFEHNPNSDDLDGII